jgi:hypothetical protein
MNLWGWGTQCIKVENMPASCKIGEGYVQGSIHEVSRTGLSLDIRTSRLQDGLNNMLHQAISLSIDNTVLEGTLSWYTLEGSFYRIGITVSEKQRSSWRKIFSNSVRATMQTSTRPVSI